MNVVYAFVSCLQNSIAMKSVKAKTFTIHEKTLNNAFYQVNRINFASATMPLGRTAIAYYGIDYE